MNIKKEGMVWIIGIIIVFAVFCIFYFMMCRSGACFTENSVVTETQTSTIRTQAEIDSFLPETDADFVLQAKWQQELDTTLPPIAPENTPVDPENESAQGEVSLDTE